MNILVVDDELDVGELVKEVLKRKMKDIVVIQINECPKALDSWDLSGIDLVLMDQIMVGISGLECLKRIRTMHKCLPVVMLSSIADEEFIGQCLEAGADDYIIKSNIVQLLPDTIKL